MRRNIFIPSLATLVLAAGLAACSAEEEPTTAPATPDQTATTQDPASEEPTEEAEPTEEPSEETEGAEETESAPADYPAGLTVTLDGKESTLELTDVYCDGAPGSLKHAIGKTDNQPPLVEVAADGFAMVKIQRQGPPEKANSLAGITIGDESVTFDDAKIGGAVLSGTMTCTSWDD